MKYIFQHQRKTQKKNHPKINLLIINDTSFKNKEKKLSKNFSSSINTNKENYRLEEKKDSYKDMDILIPCISICNYPDFYSTDSFECLDDVILEEGINDINELMKKINLNIQDKQRYFERVFQKEIPVLFPLREQMDFCYTNKNSIKNLTSLPFEYFMSRKNFDSKKINLVLDIDSTLIHAVNFEENLKTKSFIDSTDNTKIYDISIIFNEKGYNLKFKIRKFVIEFLQVCYKFCNIYICTHGVEPYAKEVVKILNSQSNIFIPEENIIANKPDPNTGINNILPKTLNS